MKAIVCLTLLASGSVCFAAAPEPGLLFYLSGDKGFTADYAAGKAEPNFNSDVKIISDGARGKGFECANTQALSYWTPGNIYAQRGTLAFSWRSRYPVGPTPFPIFRVGYADHSSWDMVWLRIDYNGEGGFDAFVTDINLSRIRVSYKMPAFPKPNEWVHLALSWDETVGIRFYVNGVLAQKKDQKAVLYAGLDQFGPHSRAISPWQVQSACNFIRGGISTRSASTTACCRTTTWPRWPTVSSPSKFPRWRAICPNPSGGKNGGCATAGTARATCRLTWRRPRPPFARWKSTTSTT